MEGATSLKQDFAIALVLSLFLALPRIAQAADTTAPVLTVRTPAPVVECAGSASASVFIEAIAVDETTAKDSLVWTYSGAPNGGTNPASYPMGNTSVTVRETDAAGNYSQQVVVVRVVDTTTPNINAGPYQVLACTAPNGLLVANVVSNK